MIDVKQLAEQAGLSAGFEVNARNQIVTNSFGLSRFAALVEAATLERAAQEVEMPVRVLHLPSAPEYDGDVRHVERRVSLGASAAIRALKPKE